MKKTTKDLIRRIKDKSKSDSVAKTFRLPIQLMDDFQAKCQAHQISMTAAVEELVRDFTYSD